MANRTTSPVTPPSHPPLVHPSNPTPTAAARVEPKEPARGVIRAAATAQIQKQAARRRR